VARLKFFNKRRAIYTNMEAKGSCPSFLGLSPLGKLIHHSLDMVRVSTHFDVGFPQWNRG
jgi:hypothetical protein